ncbi:MAG: GAF domain-containing sensor histidine kinase [Nitriliruptoraceae bacterium]
MQLGGGADRADRRDRANRADRADRADRRDRADRADRADRTDSGQVAPRAADAPSLDRVLLDLAVSFVNVPLDRLDEAIDHTLRTIGELSAVGRAYLFTYDWDDRTATNTHEWCAPGVRPVIDDLQQVSIARLQEWVDRHRAGRTVYRPDTADPALSPAERAEWQSQGITALLTIPLMVEGDCVGFVGFDVVEGPRTWSERDREQLTVLAQLLAHAAERRSMERVREAAVELAAANERLATFAAAVSHELKAPLTTIQGLLSLLRAGRVDAERQEEVLDRSISAAGRMATMIDRLLAYAAAGTEIGAAVPVSLDRAVQVSLEHLAGVVEDRRVHVDVGSLPTVLGDELRLTEVFQNLIGNAAHHSHGSGGGRIVVRGHRAGGTATVTVADDGVGIAPEDRGRVLRSFERGPQAQAPGAGMGLPLCARIISAHGGTLELGESTLGGLLVTLQLPVPPQRP